MCVVCVEGGHNVGTCSHADRELDQKVWCSIPSAGHA